MEMRKHFFLTKLHRKSLSKKSLCFCLLLVSVSLIGLFLINSQQWSKLTNRRRKVEDQLNCSCVRSEPEIFVNNNPKSTCNDWTTARGPHQLVVSYSIYGNNPQHYFRGIALNAQLVLEHYPGWLMRVYYRFQDRPEAEVREMLCPIWCEYPHLDFCPGENLPSPLFNQSSLHPMMWRVLGLGDPLVDRFVSRDLDSLITTREKAAVDEWIESGKTFHFMHDHYNHVFPIMGGMWGAINTNLSLTTYLRDELVNKEKAEKHKLDDQHILLKIVLPVAEATKDYINHDSYRCQTPSLSTSQPFPTRRNESRAFVGEATLRPGCSAASALKKPCPQQCRPAQHQDWEYC